MTAALRLPTVLIVSPHFPPSTLAGVHRARHLAKHLPKHGWKPIIIRADEKHYAETSDPGLAALVSSDVAQVRTSALPAGFSRLLGFGDIGLRAYLPILRAIEHSIVQHAPKAVIITGSPYYPMLHARRIAERWRTPVVLDFQDPWVSADGERQKRWSKAGLAHKLATLLEPRAVRSAAWITSVSEIQNDEMAARYAWMGRSRMTAIPIGGDPGDFDALRARPQVSRVALDPGRINLCYVGTFLPRAAPVVRALFEGLSLLKRRQPDVAARLKLVFVGTSNQPDLEQPGLNRHRVQGYADAAGVGDMVHEHPARVPFLEALTLLANADGILLLGSDEPHYTASKIYPALMSGRPFISIFHQNSSSHELLSRAGGGWSHCFTDAEQLPAMASQISSSLAQLADGVSPLPAKASAYEQYTADAVARRFAEVLANVMRDPQQAVPSRT
jgi:hypothetical protein